MYALDNNTGIEVMPPVKAQYKVASTPLWFTEGGNGVSPTVPGADWFNVVQAELLNVLKEASIQPTKSELNQIAKAIREIAKSEGAGKGLPVGAIIAFPHEVSNPQGFLKCDGSTFGSSTYPDLYSALSNKNTLPNLNGDIGQLAYFPVEQVPEGWLAFDEIRTKANSTDYPELHRLLVAQYGSIEQVPSTEDRFIRGLGGGLTIGQVQGDAIRNITGTLGLRKYSWVAGVQAGAFLYEGQDTSSSNGAVQTSAERGNYPVKFDASRVVPTANENRPKAIAFKLCIKAKNSSVYWIKAYGTIVNAGSLDASRLASGLQLKADKHHSHNVSDIVNIDAHVLSLLTSRSRGLQPELSQVGYAKLPNGLIFQWGNCVLNPTHGTVDNHVTFPITFPSAVLNMQVSYAENPGKRFTYNYVLNNLTASGVTITHYIDTNLKVFWFAIGY